jgi:hypothetical protein
VAPTIAERLSIDPRFHKIRPRSGLEFLGGCHFHQGTHSARLHTFLCRRVATGATCRHHAPPAWSPPARVVRHDHDTLAVVCQVYCYPNLVRRGIRNRLLPAESSIVAWSWPPHFFIRWQPPGDFFHGNTTWEGLKVLRYRRRTGGARRLATGGCCTQKREWSGSLKEQDGLTIEGRVTVLRERDHEALMRALAARRGARRVWRAGGWRSVALRA